MGAIARDGTAVLFSAWRYFERCAGAAESEALACVEGLRWATQWRMAQAILESDCALIMLKLGSSWRQIRAKPDHH